MEAQEALPDNYPVYWDYLYLVDGKVIRSDIQGTVLDFKRDLRKHFKLDALVVCKYVFK